MLRVDMEPKAKRRRVEALDGTTTALMEADLKRAPQILQDLKKVRTNDALEKKLKECPQLTDALLSLLWKCSIQNFEQQPQWIGILKDVLTVLANFCYLSATVRDKMAEPSRNVPMIAVRIMESGDKTPADVKRATLRFLSNAATSPHCAVMITGSTHLIDRIAMAVDCHDEEIVKVALRAANILGTSRCSIKPLLLANIGFYLGNLLGRTKGKEETFAREVQRAVFYLICRFVKCGGAKSIGRQLAGSSGVDTLLENFLVGRYEEAIVEMCNVSFELREQFETPGCIEKIVRAPQPRSDYMVKMLLCFAQDAWGRAALRGQGAIDVLIDQLAAGPCQEQEMIVSALRYFVHDGSGLNYITFSTKFLEIVVKHITAFLDKNQRVCKLITEEVEEIGECGAHSRMPSRRTKCMCCVLRGRPFCTVKLPTPMSFEELAKIANIDTSPGRLELMRRSWSPSQSPPPGFSSPQRSPSPVSSSSSLIDDYIESIEYSFPHDAGSKVDSNAAQSNVQDAETRIVDTLLRYIAEAPSMASKAPRAIRRIFRHRLAVENLSRLELHTRVIHTLMARKCSAGKRLGRCSECAIRADFGDVLLDEFASHIDAPFGLEILKNLYKSSNEMEQIKACIATIHLVRRSDNWKTMLTRYQPVQFLLTKLREILSDSNYQEKWRVTTYDNGPSLLHQILVALSYLIPSDQLMKSLRSEWTDICQYIYQHSPFNICTISYANLASDSATPTAPDSPEFITFKCGDRKEIVPKKRLCEGSEYFRGMFGNAFSEQFRDTLEFSEEKEQCGFSVFCWFLHFVCGCGKNCLNFKENDVPSLLKLSDRYLCSSLSAILLAPDGPLKNEINGQTLPSYLEVMLSTGSDAHGVLRDACISCLLRYCTEDEMFDALKVVAGNPVATGVLVEQLETFLMVYSRQRKTKCDPKEATRT